MIGAEVMADFMRSNERIAPRVVGANLGESDAVFDVTELVEVGDADRGSIQVAASEQVREPAGVQFRGSPAQPTELEQQVVRRRCVGERIGACRIDEHRGDLQLNAELRAEYAVDVVQAHENCIARFLFARVTLQKQRIAHRGDLQAVSGACGLHERGRTLQFPQQRIELLRALARAVRFVDRA